MASTRPADSSESSLAGGILRSLSLREIGVCTKARFDRGFDSDYRKQSESILVNTVASCVAKMLNVSRVVHRSAQEGSAL
jgi:hypothetical protein